MDAETRRKEIIAKLLQSHKPLSATALAKDFHVSRQIIVGDVALLRASGTDVEATPRGYVIRSITNQPEHQIACKHSSEQMCAELYAIVDQGCIVKDVIVEHPIYGQLTGSLQLANRYDVDQFIEKNQKSDAVPLSFLTEGIHLHTLICPDEAAYGRVLQALQTLGVLLPQN